MKYCLDMPAVLSPAYREACLWQEQVPRERRSVEDVPDSVDVVVIGAGYCGLNAAATVAAAGASVVVLDKEPLGWGASSRNGGMVIPELKSSPVALVKKIGPLGAQLYAEVEQAFDSVQQQAKDVCHTPMSM